MNSYKRNTDKKPLQNIDLSRLESIIGPDAIQTLANSRVAVFGVGGVGSFAAEALARAGVGEIDLFDNETIDSSNVNRQIMATSTTIGKSKVNEMAKRITDINPACKVRTYDIFYDSETAETVVLSRYNYVLDCIDSVKSKIELIVRSNALSVPIISSMGTANKLEPTKLEVSNITKTSVCPLAKIIRKELKSHGISTLKCIYSKEEPVYFNNQKTFKQINNKSKLIPGSTSFVPSVAGLIMASEVIKDIIKEH